MPALLAFLLISSFAHGHSSLASQDLAQQMYVAYYGRPADPGGQGYWAENFDASPSLESALAAFGNSQEFNDSFGVLSNEQLVSGLFQQMFNRDSDPVGLDFYVGRLASGAATLASIAKQIADGAVDADLVTLNNKIIVANQFSDHIEINDVDYLASAIPAAKALLAAVTTASDTVDSALETVARYPYSNAPVDALAAAISNMDFPELLDVAGPAIELRDPESVVAASLADEYGLTDATLTDVRFGYRNITYDMWQVIRDRLDEIDRNSLIEQDQLSFDIYDWQVNETLALREFMHFEYQATYFLFSVPSGLELFFQDLQPVANSQDAEDYLARLALVDDKLAQLISNLQVMEQKGVIEPAVTMTVAIDVHSAIFNQPNTTNPYYQNFRDKVGQIPGLTGSQVGSFRQRALDILNDEIKPAYRILVEFLRDQVNRAPEAIGVGQFPNGDAYYRQRLRFHTTTTMTPQEIHQLGRQELERIHAEARVIFDRFGYPQNESLEQLFNRAAVDGGSIAPANSIPTIEALIDDAELRMQSLFSRQPEGELAIIGVDSGGYYVSGSLDGSRPGAYYATTTSSRPYYQLPTIVYHESMPGHHMQIATAQEADIPDFRRDIGFNGYVEGWGLYAERLAGDYGWYENDAFGDLGRLYWEGVRAARLAVDTGIHHYGWSFDQATNFFRANVGSSLGSAQGNVARYTLYTGQATSYMVGMLKLVELRERMRTALGDDFNIQDFHDLVLNNGAMPLTILEDLIDQVIAVHNG